MKHPRMTWKEFWDSGLVYPPANDIRVVGLAALATERVIETLGFHLRTEKRRKQIHEAILYELRRSGTVVNPAADWWAQAGDLEQAGGSTAKTVTN